MVGVAFLGLLSACADGGSAFGADASEPGGVFDAALGADAAGDSADAAINGSDAAINASDAGSGPDAVVAVPDAAVPDAQTSSIITGGPCMSGAGGATAYRVRWVNAGGTAQVVYEVNGLPDKSRDHTGAFGFTIPYTPPFVDPFLGDGGLQLDSSNFVDIEISTDGVAQIDTATLSIFGRSFNTTTSGSFNWQTFSGTGAAPTNLVSNVAPYQWYSADMTTEIDPGDDGVLIRIKSGPSSNSLVVNRIEICMNAD